MGDERLTKLTLRNDGSSLEIEAPESVASAVRGYVSELQAKLDSLEEKNARADMESYELDGKTYKDMGSLYKDMCEVSKKYKDMASKYEDMKSEYDKMKGRNDAMTQELEKRDDVQLLAEQVKARRKLERTAKSLLKDFSVERFDSMSDLEVKKAIAQEHGFDAEAYNEDGLSAMIEVLEKNTQQRDAKYQEQVKVFSSVERKDSSDDEAFGWTATAIEEIENAWKKGGSE